LFFQDYIPLSDFIQSHFFKLRRETKTVFYGAAVMGVFNQLSTLGKMAKGTHDLYVRNTPPLQHSQSDSLVIQSTQISVAPLTRSVSSMPSPSDSIEEDTGSDSTATTLLQM